MSLTHVLSLQKFGKGVSAWLENDTLWKEFKAEPGGGATVTCSPLRWKPGKNLVEKAAAKEDGMTFFQWFTETGEEDELAQLLRDEIYADPLVFFGQVPEDSDASGDEEEEAEGEDE